MMKNDVMNYALEAGIPYLLGTYVPTFKEIIGEIPKDINGVYVLNPTDSLVTQLSEL